MANPGVKLEDVKTAVSMPIALGQCRKTIRRMKLKTEAAGGTDRAGQLLAELPGPDTGGGSPALFAGGRAATKAAASQALAAENYVLEILARDIEDEHNNTTRFLVM